MTTADLFSTDTSTATNTDTTALKATVNMAAQTPAPAPVATAAAGNNEAPNTASDPDAAIPAKRQLRKNVISRQAPDIVVCNMPPATFTEALELLAASGTVDPERMQSFRRDVKRAQGCLPANKDGSPAAPLPCDPVLLRPILQKIRPAQHKISAKRFYNITNELAAIQRKTGWLPPKAGVEQLQTTAWQTGLNLIADEPAAAMFRAFAAYCEARALAPDAVTADELTAYQEHIAQNSARRNPKNTVDALRYAWNKLCRLHPEWSGKLFPQKRDPDQIRDDAHNIPASYFADMDAYLAKLRDPGLFNRRIPRKVAPATIRTRTGILELVPHVLVLEGWKPETLTSLQAIITPAAVEAILTAYHRRNCQDQGWTYGAETTASALKMLAKHWGELAPQDLAEVCRLCDAVKCPPSAFPRRAQERLRQFDDRAVERRFWDLPRKLWHDVLPKHERAGRLIKAARIARAALILAIGFDKPLRLTNHRCLDLAHDFTRDRKGRITGIRIEGERTTKNAPVIEGALSPRTQNMLVKFLDVYRPRLLKAPSTALFPGEKHDYLSEDRFRGIIKDIVLEHIGIDVNPHLLRSLIGTVILDEDPRAVALAQRMLDHRTPTTTLRSYAMQRGRAVANDYANILNKRIRRLSK
ncbi:integrase [Acidocella sp. KAb 2-4]|uniref:integrase n=1 Tax=Acidocella sp. KAb 2-4 TaxID=2885158 RepID=UPI001D06C572|nr:integrase [Acidocella sp. KAb 2-4]MCB5946094.1 integrase [Acidocella sp. KAb 2-4]